MSEIKNAPEGAAQDCAVKNLPNFSTTELKVQELIKQASSERPIRRAELARKVGVQDRIVRLAIEKLRHEGERILSGEKGGYYYAENEHQYRMWRSSITSRLLSMSSMIWAMDAHTEGQTEMEVI